MVCASEFKINLPETVIPGSDSYFGYNKELEREPYHCLDLDKGSESNPCISIFLDEMWNPTLCSLPKKSLPTQACPDCLLLPDSVASLLSLSGSMPISLIAFPPLSIRHARFFAYEVSPLMFSLASLAGCHARLWIPSPREAATAVCPVKGPNCLLCTKQKKTSINRSPNCPYGRFARRE